MTRVPHHYFPLNVKISKKAKDGWERYAREAGVSITALIEAIGLDMAEREPSRRGEELFKRAREIAWKRSRRPKNGRGRD